MFEQRFLFELFNIILLIVKKKIVNIEQNEGKTPLWWACRKGCSNLTSQLLISKASIDQEDIDGATPLFIAAQEGHKEVVKILLNNGADMYKATNYGETPASVAATCGHLGVLRQLLKYGYKIDHPSNAPGYTILHIATMNNQHLIVNMLLNEFNGKSIINNASNGFKDTPLTIGVWVSADLEMVKLLAEGGANKLIKNGQSDGIRWKRYECQTPLEWARERGKLDIVKYLQN